ncbi:MAG: hypothetical protein IT307_20490 [Chloroflexi bacterium]|nr:hypothetical protein [Chloroflexota bacterium]
MRARPAWAAIPKAVQPLGEAILGLAGHLGGLQSLFELAGRGGEAWEDLNGELAAQASLLVQTEERLRHAMVAPDRSMVYWLAIGRGQDVEVHAAPLDVAEVLRHALFGEKETLILTSATLAAAQRFDYVRERLGVPEPRELIVGSPFDYLQSTLLYLPEDVPEPNQTGFQAAVERAIGSVVAALDGRTMALFTSHSQLRATYQALKAPLSQRGITLLGQGLESSSRERLLQQFRQGERVALFGTSSFWEGVDVVGEALSCLVIVRLPFTAPSDPVFQARGEAFQNAFNEYAVPQAVIRLRQGFGRLIRSREDRGMVVMLDSRLTRRGYGRAFLSSLPRCTVVRGPVSRLASAARDWLSKAVDDGVSV